MRLPRLRFTIRRLMLAVLITALLLGRPGRGRESDPPQADLLPETRSLLRPHDGSNHALIVLDPRGTCGPHEEECLLRGAEGRIRIRR